VPAAAAATAPVASPLTATAAPPGAHVGDLPSAWPDDEFADITLQGQQASRAEVGSSLPTSPSAQRFPPEALPAGAWAAPMSAEPATAVAKPGFIKDAERSARWNSPAMRAALSGLSLMLLVMLAGQAAFHFRDSLAARSPVAASVLGAVCARWACRIEPLRRIQDVTLEGSGLSRIAQRPQAIKLSISLRNRSSIDLALPSIDLSLNDINGKLIARRALSPQDFKVGPPLIVRGTELPLELVLSTGDQPVSAYTVELFYP
jgi:hypothetical protein